MQRSGRDRRRSRLHDPGEEFYDSQNGAVNTSQMMHMSAEAVPMFDGRDTTYPVSKWVDDVETNSEIFGWTPIQTLLIARRSLSGTAALWLRAERPFKCWEDLKTALAKEFPDNLDAKTIHEIMSTRKKEKDESCTDYMLIMKELGRRGKMPDYVAIKYIIDGIIDKEWNKIMLYGVTSYAEFKEKLRIYETVSRKSSQIHSKKEGVSGGETRIRCYNCGNLGHTSFGCPAKEKGMKCFKCNDFGHIASNCKMADTSSTTRPENGAAPKHTGNVRYRGNNYQPKRTSFSERAMFGFDNEKSTSLSSTHFTLNDGGNVGSVVKQVEGNSMTLTTSQKTVKADVKETNDFSEKTKPIKKIVLNGNSEINALIDSGSDVNLLSEKFYSELLIPKCNDSLVLSGLGSAKVESLGQCSVSLKIDDRNFDKVTFHIVSNESMPYSVIIGQEFLKSVVMVMNGGCVSIFPKDVEWMANINCFSCTADIVGPIKNPVVQEKVVRLIEEYKPQQTKEATVELKIIVKDDVPVAQRPRRLSMKEQQEVDKQIQQWLEEGIIKVSFSEYSSPIVLVKKKDGSTRICVDYRLINKKILKDEYPLPIIDDLIDMLANAKVFSALDLKNGYFHLKVGEQYTKYTAFVTKTGQYEFLRAPFGLTTCPKVFMRYITAIFRDLIASGIVIIFIDDILIPAGNENEAVERLEIVLQRASEYGLNINWKKSQLLVKRVEYLGHVIQDGVVMTSTEKTEAVIKFPEPRNMKQLRSFLGLCSYFRKFIHNYAELAQPLTDLLGKEEVSFQFTIEQQESFELLKKKLTSNPVLRIYDPKAETELHTDASSKAYSAILMQKCSDDGELHPVYYMSRRTSEAERKYTSYELEALAIIEGVKKFRHYLHGIYFKIITDCKAFQMTLDKKDLAMSTRVARWVLLLQDYNFKIEHRSGVKMKHTDALSRNPYVSVITDLHKQLQCAQENDDGLKAIMQVLNEGQTYQDYYLHQGLLRKGQNQSLVVPRKMEDSIIRRAHENGHFAKKKTMELISKDYYIENLEKKVIDLITSCVPCILGSRKEGKQEGFLHPLSKEEGPLHTLHVDHIGPLAETKKKYNYILTVVDAFTKFVWIFPVKTVAAKETIDKMEILQQTFGNPARIISDKGAAFTSKDFEDFCEREGIRHSKITTGVPRGNGQVERIHRTIISVLTKLNVQEPTQWYKHTSKLQRALNSTYQRSIKTTPFELLTGVKIRQKEDLELLEMLEEEYVSTFMTQREELKSRAKENILKIQEENKKNFNKKRTSSTEYKKGDLVAIKRTQFGTAMKLKPKYLGPYKITSVNGKDRYEVERISDSGEGSKKTTTCAEFMKKWSHWG